MAQTAGRGTSWVSVVFGWLAALGAALILSSIVGAIVGALFAALGAKKRHHRGWDIRAHRRAFDAADSLLPRRLCRRAHGEPLWSQARAVGGPAGFSGNDCTGAHRSGGGRKFHRPAWRRHTARSGREGCTECPTARDDHHLLGLWHPRPVVPVHRGGTRGLTWGQSRTRAPLPILNKGQSRFGSRLGTLAALAR
jgi:hypothetical protein